MRAAFESIVAGSHSSFTYRTFKLRAFPFRWHFHPEYELTAILAGQGRRFVGDHQEAFAPGDLVLLGKDLPHTWHSEPSALPHSRRPAGAGRWQHGGGARAVCVQFLEGFAGRKLWAAPELARIGRLLRRSARGLRFGARTQQQVVPRLEAMGRLDPCARLLELLAILDLLARRSDVTELSSPGFVPSLRGEDQQRIDKVYRYINANFAGDLPLADVAARAHLSPAALSRFFRKHSGKQFTTYVNELRIGLACRLLIETDRSIAEIALAVGFKNLSNFNRRFLEFKQQRPRDFRGQFRAAGSPPARSA